MILKNSDKGTLVEKLQEKLGINPDGVFGQGTETVVKMFQEQNGLKVDGVAGKDVFDKLGLDISRYIVNGSNKDVSWELPSSGVGFVTYNRESRGDQFGLKSTISNCIKIAEEWSKVEPDAKIQFGDISYLYGGDTPDHVTHEQGKDVDLRLFTKDGKYLPITYQDSNYSRELTRKFLQLVKNKVKGVYFNDPILIKEGLCRASAGHSNHVHLMF